VRRFIAAERLTPGFGLGTAVQISLINLDRTPDRLAEFHRLNPHLSEVSRFRAVDGRTLDVSALTSIRLIERSIAFTYTKGALGCALSHLALWEKAIAKDEAVTICEDDAIFNRGFAETAGRLVATLPADWDMVLWGWNFDSVVVLEMLPGVTPCCLSFDQDAMREGVESFQEQRFAPQLFRLHRALGLVCYSISPKGARILRDRCLPLRPVEVFFPRLDRMLYNNGIDIPMNDAYPEIAAYVSFPPLVITKNDHMVTTVQYD
jgi:glycosyl transferase, family 25